MSRALAPRLLLGATVLAAAATGFFPACSNVLNGSSGEADMSVSAPDQLFTGPFTDFPAMPTGEGGLADATKLAEVASAFASAASVPTGGPCVSEPTLGALYPLNFTPPLFEWSAANQNVYELRFHIENQTQDLVVYTDKSSFTLADNLWQQLTLHSVDRDIEITVRGGQLSAGKLTGGALIGSKGSIRIAPVAALGSIVYWTTSNNSALKGFHIGDKAVSTVMDPARITSAGKDTRCVGCHVSTPDGNATLFSRQDPTVTFNIDARVLDGTVKRPANITANAFNLLGRSNQTLPTMSKVHYTANEAVAVSVLSHADTANKWELVWTDLLSTTGGSGILKRTGDPRQPANPSWSPLGEYIAYISSSNVIDGRPDTGDGEVWVVPFNNRMGGTAKALPGASDSKWNQYYPVFSPSETFVAYNRAPRGTNMYDQAQAEVFIVPFNSSQGGTATRLKANDTSSCSTVKSPGLTNSWPRWAPTATQLGNKRYYWLVFSSKRRPGSRPQLFLSAVVTTVDAGGRETLDSEYPAIYIPTQPAAENNHTPAWDEFKIPVAG